MKKKERIRLLRSNSMRPFYVEIRGKSLKEDPQLLDSRIKGLENCRLPEKLLKRLSEVKSEHTDQNIK